MALEHKCEDCKCDLSRYGDSGLVYCQACAGTIFSAPCQQCHETFKFKRSIYGGTFAERVQDGKEEWASVSQPICWHCRDKERTEKEAKIREANERSLALNRLSSMPLAVAPKRG